MALPGQYFQKLVESCPDIIISVDKQGTIIFYNDGARQNLGFSYEEVLGKNVLEIYPSLAEARRVMAAMRAADAAGEGRIRNFETVFKTKKGDKIPVAISASMTYDEQGTEIGSIGFAKDIRPVQSNRCRAEPDGVANYSRLGHRSQIAWRSRHCGGKQPGRRIQNIRS